MINNIYRGKNKRKPLWKRNKTQTDQSLKRFAISKFSKHTTGQVPTFLNVSVNGKQISEHFSPNFKSVQVTAYKPHNELPCSVKHKNINIKQYINRKYVSDAISSEASKEYDINPQMEKIMRLRKIFNDKGRNKSCCDTGDYNFGGKQKSKRFLKTDISQMIKITNPDIYSSTFARKFQKQHYIEKQRLKKERDEILLKSRRKQKISGQKMKDMQFMIAPWEAD